MYLSRFGSTVRSGWSQGTLLHRSFLIKHVQHFTLVPVAAAQKPVTAFRRM